jgi:riboflavin kinase/FMN adenylyltransferase
MIVRELTDVGARPRRVAIGNFDGVHLGHQAIVRGCDTVLTFAPHPLAILAPGRAPLRLGTLDDRADRLAALGVRELVVVPFDPAFAALSCGDFMRRVLVERLRATHVSVGANFRFGAGAAGDAGTLAACTRFTVCAHPLVQIRGVSVSSSRVRASVLDGDVELAAQLLGRPHRLPCEAGETGRHDEGVVLRPEVGFAFPRSGSYKCRVISGRTRQLRRCAFLRVSAPALPGQDRTTSTLQLIDCDRIRPGEELSVELLSRVARSPQLVTSHEVGSREGLHALVESMACSPPPRMRTGIR